MAPTPIFLHANTWPRNKKEQPIQAATQQSNGMLLITLKPSLSLSCSSCSDGNSMSNSQHLFTALTMIHMVFITFNGTILCTNDMSTNAQPAKYNNAALSHCSNATIISFGAPFVFWNECLVAQYQEEEETENYVESKWTVPSLGMYA